MEHEVWAIGFRPAAFYTGLKLIKQFGVGEILHHKTLELQRSKCMQVSVQVQPNHLAGKACCQWQQALKRLAVYIALV